MTRYSSVLELLVARQLEVNLDSCGLLTWLQSIYKANHSIKIAVLKLLSDILLGIEDGNLPWYFWISRQSSTQ